VLVDSEPIALRIEVEMLAALGAPMPEAEVVERFVGRSPEVIQEAIETRLGRALPANWDEPYRQMRREAFERELAAVAGVKEALEQIPEPTCVASSSQPESLRFKLELTGVYDRFRGRIFSASEVANGKPAPDLFLHAASRLGFEPSDCVVVEDSRYGVQAARAAGMDVLAYASGLTPVAALQGVRTTVFTDMRELPGLVGRMRRRAVR
jgi:HAD superfamily hydrolase (TIGR01509 family)